MSNPLNILIDARPLVDRTAGGVRRVAQTVLSAMVHATDGVAYTFVTTGWRRPELPVPFQNRPSVTHVHIPLPNKLWSALCLLGVTALDREVSRRTKKTYQAALLPNLGFTGRLSIPYALILHDLSFLIEPRWFPWKMRVWHRAVGARGLIRRAARLFCVSETTARDAERLLGVSRDRIEVFSPGVGNWERMELGTRNWERIEPQFPVPSSIRSQFPVPSSRFLLAFNESNPRKNVSTAIAAVSRLRQDPAFADLQLVIVGSDKRPQTADRRPQTAHPRRSPFDWITRLPHVTDSDLADLYQYASAVLYPSWYEGFGLPLHEAARFCTPCLASAHGALPETAPEGTLFIPPAKPHLWAATLGGVLRHPELYRTVYDATLDEPNVSGILRWMRM